MAVPTNTKSTYNVGAGANMRSVSKILGDVSPFETPLLTAMGTREKAAQNHHEWVTDALPATGDSFAVEGDTTPASSIEPRVTLSNYTQIFKEVITVSGSQMATKQEGGIRNEMAYQVGRHMKRIKKNVEWAILRKNVAKDAGAAGTARRMGSLDSYFTSDHLDISTAGTASTITGAGNGLSVVTATGTDRTLTESMFRAAIRARWDQASESNDLIALMPSDIKEAVSSFRTGTGAVTRNVTADLKTLTEAIDVYQSNNGTVTLLPSRQARPNALYLIDPDELCLADLREPMMEDLAKNGDAYVKQVLWETTLVVKDPNAHYGIQDIST